MDGMVMKEEGPVTHRSPETGVMAATQGHEGKAWARAFIVTFVGSNG